MISLGRWGLGRLRRRGREGGEERCRGMGLEEGGKVM